MDIIKKMTIPHCARGPDRCEKCKKAAEEEKICLLRVYFKAGNIARPVTKTEKNGRIMFCEYDVLKIFENEREAKKYAEEKAINVQFP